MKKLYFGTALLFIALTSCSSSDDSSGSNPTSFLPLEANSSWVYDVNLDASEIGRDSLYVSGETTLNGKTYKQLKVKDVPAGFYTNSLNNNSIRIDGSKLLLSGSTGLALADVLPINIDVTDFVIFKEDATNNAQLDAISGTIEQDLQELPLKIDYTLKSTFKESLSSFAVPGKETYTNVKVMKLVVNLKVSTEVLIPGTTISLPVSILESQDVIVSTHYYAEGAGMIYAKTEINYSLNDFSLAGVTLPIPQEGASTIEEFLN
ncbi:hypothetical protein [Flavobacterium sp. SM2513]|uniref:hypothetical protein n=1 Tax=Flavobacterium sp. SM2513 TaxID=3424766 RepID=UPI003D7F9E9D